MLEVVYLHLILQIYTFACVKEWLQRHISAKNTLVFTCRYIFISNNRNIKLVQTFAGHISEGYAEKSVPGLLNFPHSGSYCG